MCTRMVLNQVDFNTACTPPRSPAKVTRILPGAGQWVLQNSPVSQCPWALFLQIHVILK